MNIDIQQYRSWKNDPVTVEVMRVLQRIQSHLTTALTNPELIMEKDSGKTMARLLGQRDGIEMILNIQPTDLIPQEEKDEDSSDSA